MPGRGQPYRSYRRAVVVLVGNEAWNAMFSSVAPTARDGLLGILAFLLPLGLLQVSVAEDRISTFSVGSSTVWVVGYEVPWTFRTWRLNTT